MLVILFNFSRAEVLSNWTNDPQLQSPEQRSVIFQFALNSLLGP
jgi:hypothetical protein